MTKTVLTQNCLKKLLVTLQFNDDIMFMLFHAHFVSTFNRYQLQVHHKQKHQTCNNMGSYKTINSIAEQENYTSHFNNFISVLYSKQYAILHVTTYCNFLTNFWRALV